jgi:sugar (pentulose or hexulose) kinase
MEGSIVALGGRAVQLMKRVGLEPDFALAGGMTHNTAMVAALEGKLGAPLRLPPHGLGQLNGAFGAALLGLRRVERLLADGREIASPAGAEAFKPRRWSTYVPGAITAPASA